ncbi:MAG TPA: FtsX-like permease family protein [Gemmatimonadaceae bacterium]
MLPIRGAIKSLRRSPGFATVSILSLALSLGLVAAVFALVDGLRHPRTATRDPEHLYEIRMRGEGAAGRITAAEHIEMLQRFAQSTESFAFSTWANGQLFSNGVPIDGSGQRVSANFFDVRGVKPISGRSFAQATAGEDAVASVIISERVWQQVFDRNPRLDRLAIRIEDAAGDRIGQVIGVMPQELVAETRASFWLALPPDLNAYFATERFVVAMARLKPGATFDQLNAEFTRATDYLRQLHGKGRIDFLYTAKPMKVDPLRIDEMIWLLLGAAIAVLLVACANLANLVLARGLSRQGELAVRVSLGATRRDIVSGVLAECLVVALAGAVLGLLAAAWGISVVRANMPERLGTGMLAIAVSWRVILMSSGAAAVAALVFGLLPAIRLSDVRLAQYIKEQSGTTTGRRRGRFPVLVVGQVALSLAMLTGVSLLLRASFITSRVDFGFDPARILSVNLYTRSPSDTSTSARLALWSAAEKRLKELHGAEAVAWSSGVGLFRSPSLTGERSGGAFRTRYMPRYTYASPNLLRTVGVTIIRGRDFEDRDAFGDGVVVLDSVTALRIWGSEDPIGKLVKFAVPERISPWFRVIGVSRPVLSDVPSYAGADIDPQVWMVGRTAFVSPSPDLRGPRQLLSSIPSRSFVVRGRSNDVAALRAEIPRVLRDLLPPRGSVFVYGWDDNRKNLIAGQRFLAGVFGIFGVLSLSLCALGLYSVLSYAVTQRTREVGIRVALGATSRQIFRDVLHDGAVLVIAGTAVGGLATLFSNKLVDEYIGLLYHVDVWALVAAELVLVGVAMLAMLRPALRATRSDPVAVLRAV